MCKEGVDKAGGKGLRIFQFKKDGNGLRVSVEKGMGLGGTL